MMKSRKVRCTCSNCGAIRYLNCRDIDRGEEHFLCDTCNDAFIHWGDDLNNNSPYVDAFLKTSGARRARAASNAKCKTQ